VTAARIGFTGPGGARHVLGRLGPGLALAVAAAAPVRVADALMDRLAVPAPDGDLLGPFLPAEMAPAPVPGHARRRPRFEPSNLAFADGLDRWELDGSFRRAAQGGGPGHPAVSGSHWHDYAAAAAAPAAMLAAAVPDPHGTARLAQAIRADDYLGATVTFRAQVRAAGVAGHASLELRIRADQPLRPARGEDDDAGRHAVRITGTSDWASHEITARVPADANVITFGITLTGRGEVALRGVELSRGT
jgi:hypothetical protein